MKKLIRSCKSPDTMKRQNPVALVIIIAILSNPAVAQDKINFGFWTQAWYQHVVNEGRDLNDFMVRRAYFSVKGQAADYLSFFTHIAVDRLGQEGLDNASQGFGSGLTFRDLWVTLDLDEAFKVQAGRMYVPLTRNYGTTSTKALLTTDLSLMQGGVRGGIFYTSKVGRDDGVTLWGNPFDGLLQYRFMISEGMEGADNPGDKLRFAGRLMLSFLEPEKEWFNQGTYLGGKKVLSIGAGFDNQSKLTLNNIAGQHNTTWTIDGFIDHPLGGGAITVESAYISIHNSSQAHSLGLLEAGDDASLAYVQAGYFLGKTPGTRGLQPYLRYETVSIEQKDEVSFLSGGANYYLKGHNAKISMDYTVVNKRGASDQDIVTVQLALGI